MLRSRASMVTIVNNDDIFFIPNDKNVTEAAIQQLSLTAFLADDASMDSLSADLRDMTNALLIIPEYWVGQAQYQLQSKKRSIVEAFIERKLSLDNPDMPDVHLYYTYEYHSAQDGKRDIHVHFLQDEKAYALYQRLEALGLTPQEITAPAFLWQRRLKKSVAGFAKGGYGIIQKYKTAAYLYFFVRGRYLFSRSIGFSQTTADPAENISALSYELSQSLYLYSQKAKSELHHLLLMSDREQDVADLAQNMDREVEHLAEASQPAAPLFANAHFGPIAAFGLNELQVSGDLLTLAQKMHAKERAWKPVQIMGMVVGLVLLALLGVEYYLLSQWTQPDPFLADSRGIMAGQTPKDIIEKYNESLNLLIQEAERPDVVDTLVNVLRSLPPDIAVKKLNVRVQDDPGVALAGLVETRDMQVLNRSISRLLENLATHFTGSRQLKKQDVTIQEADGADAQDQYLINVAFRLP